MKQRQSELNEKRAQTTRRNLLVVLLSLFVAAVWAGCKQDAKVTTDANPVGTYALVSIDGNKMPCPVQHERAALTIKSGTFTINAEGTCSSKVVFSPPSGGNVTREAKASYTRQGSKLAMQWEGAGTTTGTVESDAFTMNNEGMIFAYRK